MHADKAEKAAGLPALLDLKKGPAPRFPNWGVGEGAGHGLRRLNGGRLQSQERPHAGVEGRRILLCVHGRRATGW